MSAHLLPGFQWMPGMRVLPDAANLPARMVYAGEDGHAFAHEAPVRMIPGGKGSDPGVDAWSDDAYTGEEEPDWSDPATGGCLMVLLGTEAWRVRYSPSIAKQAAGTPWVADLWSADGTRVRMYPSQGEACAAVAQSLGRWPGGAP